MIWEFVFTNTYLYVVIPGCIMHSHRVITTIKVNCMNETSRSDLTQEKTQSRDYNLILNLWKITMLNESNCWLIKEYIVCCANIFNKELIVFFFHLTSHIISMSRWPHCCPGMVPIWWATWLCTSCDSVPRKTIDRCPWLHISGTWPKPHQST